MQKTKVKMKRLRCHFGFEFYFTALHRKVILELLLVFSIVCLILWEFSTYRQPVNPEIGN